MENIYTLNELSSGEKARVLKLLNPVGMQRRLFDLGFSPGTLVECVGKSPLGDPSAYLLRGAVIALRSEDAELVRIRKEV